MSTNKQPAAARRSVRTFNSGNHVGAVYLADRLVQKYKMALASWPPAPDALLSVPSRAASRCLERCLAVPRLQGSSHECRGRQLDQRSSGSPAGMSIAAGAGSWIDLGRCRVVRSKVERLHDDRCDVAGRNRRSVVHRRRSRWTSQACRRRPRRSRDSLGGDAVSRLTLISDTADRELDAIRRTVHVFESVSGDRLARRESSRRTLVAKHVQRHSTSSGTAGATASW